MLCAQIPEAIDTPCFCVGKQTAQCAKDNGFQQITVADGDVESLLDTIIQHEAPQETEWFHLRGRDHIGGLVQRLQQKGYNAQGVCGYNAEPITHLAPEVITAITDHQVHGVLLYSPRTAKLFELLVQLHGLLHCCPAMAIYGLSPAVLEALRADWGQKWSPAQADADMLEARIIQEGMPL